MMRIGPDKERARSLVKLAMLRYGKIKTYNVEKEAALVAEGYYEIIKELITAILFIDGYKTTSHKDLVEYIGTRYQKEVPESEIQLIDHLRKLRNGIVYYGESIEPSYIRRNEQYAHKIIDALFALCGQKLELPKK